MKKSNIILIGMPGSGKSTIGVVLAKKKSLDFIDTDVLIQTAEKRSLQAIIDSDGYMELRRIEENTLLKLNVINHVISTGGSAAYSNTAMNHLKKSGIAVFLHVQLPILLERVHDFDTRGLAKHPDQTFEDLFYERFALYKKYADITIDNSYLTTEEACETIIRCIR